MEGGTLEEPIAAAGISDATDNWHIYSLIWAGPGEFNMAIDGVTTCTDTKYVPSIRCS